MTNLKSLFVTTLLTGGALVFEAPAASALVVCDDWGRCWPVYAPNYGPAYAPVQPYYPGYGWNYQPPPPPPPPYPYQPRWQGDGEGYGGWGQEQGAQGRGYWQED
jgi:hypothetical protein